MEGKGDAGRAFKWGFGIVLGATLATMLGTVIWIWGGALMLRSVADDCGQVKQTVKELEAQVVDLKNQRETLSMRVAREQRDKEVCRKELSSLKGGR